MNKLLLIAVMVALVMAVGGTAAAQSGCEFGIECGQLSSYGYWWRDYYTGEWHWYDFYGWPNYGQGEGANMCGIMPDATWHGQPC